MKEKSKIITYAVSGITLSVVILNIITLIFPALLTTSIVSAENNVDSFEIGTWAILFFIINITILVYGILYIKKILPNIINKSFRLILNLEVSRNIAIIVFSILIGIYIIFTVPEINQEEIDVWKDWQFLGPIIEEFPYGGDEKPTLRIQYVKNFLLFSSQEIFQNVKVIPFVGSISLIFLTYFFTVQLTKKRFAGLVAIGILLQSHTFLRYDTTATFSNFWVSFYLFSLYLINKKWSLSPLAYIGSIFSKALTITYLPMTVFFIYVMHIAKKTKIILTISYLIVFGVIIGLVVYSKTIGFGNILSPFDLNDFISGLTSWSFQLRIDGLILIFLLPLVVGLVIKSHQGFREASSVLFLIGGILFSAPLLAGFSDFNIQPYRWMPLIVFFGIGVGMLFQKYHVTDR